ncbi:inactive cell surface hyaluronidase CEMIP2-like [Saccostrea echinata]|uniref:inactive cell surface hyaluronidase CEMIP2-like n=1 Tax=Saccostrea echinata TaxID=191078 RepID=UPI002A82D7F7|nr:inactive cell surface hyaluronidase CEMIP2-like [Saccostrea echinata]
MAVSELCLFLLGFCGIAAAQISPNFCPHEQPDVAYKAWSSASSWSTGKVPVATDDVTLDDGIYLLDTSVNVRSITVGKDATLVFKDADLTVMTRYILVRGALYIGSETCELKSNVEITLYGDKGDVSIPGFGEKFIGVESGGVLHLHGSDKLPWTKLTQTVRKAKDGEISDLYNDDGVKKAHYQGIVMYVWNATSGQLEEAKGVYAAGRYTITKAGNQCEADEDAKQFEQTLKAVPDGKIVGLALIRHLLHRGNVNYAMFYEIFENFAFGKVTGNSGLRDLRLHDAWSFVMKKGDTSSSQEMFLKDDKVELERAAELYHYENNIKFTVRSWVHTIRRGACYARGKSAQADIADPKLSLTSDVTSWKDGDEVVLLSTDYDPKQAEVTTIKQCADCGSSEARINLEPRFTHFGQMVNGVDMRGEVASLSRNIKIRGAPAANSKTLGGHIKVLKGFKEAQVENVELVNMGQLDSLGNYPFHWHMCGDVTNSYIRGSVIRDSNARCVTVHGTNGAVVDNNVCFNAVGHGYFLEEGGEVNTVLNGNLGAGNTRTDKLTKTDGMPSTFWITNPKTTLTNNVAGGSDYAGIWYVFPDEPIGVSYGVVKTMQKDEAKRTPIKEFTNNVVHSNRVAGLFFDRRLNNNTSFGWGTKYTPLSDPLDEKSAPQTAVFNRLTGYKNEMFNGWFDASNIHVTQSSFSDSLMSLAVRRSGNGPDCLVTNSVFMGESINIGEPSVIRGNGMVKTYPRAVPLRMANQPRQGFVFYDRAVSLEDSWFGNYASTADYNAGAIGFQRNNMHLSAHGAYTKGLQWGFNDASEGNRVFDGNSTDLGFTALDGDDIAVFKDVDGSTTGTKGSFVVKPLPFHMTEQCEEIDSWKMAICPHAYGQVRANFEGKVTDEITVTRDDDPDDPVTADRRSYAPFLTILGGSHSYLVRSNANKAPGWWRFEFLGLSSSNYASLAVCIPRQSTVRPAMYNLKTEKWERGVPVSTFEDFQKGTSFKDYFVDTEVGAIFLKAMHIREQLDVDRGNCLDNKCPFVHFSNKDGDRTDMDCTDRFYAKYKKDKVLPSRKKRQAASTDKFPATQSAPPSNWGAGSTAP